MKKSGKVVWFKKHFGYGFIRVDGDAVPNAFFHFSDLQMDGYKTIKKNQRVTFTLKFTRKGPMAREVSLA